MQILKNLFTYIRLELEPTIEEVNYLRIPDHNLLLYFFALQTLADSVSHIECFFFKESLLY